MMRTWGCGLFPDCFETYLSFHECLETRLHHELYLCYESSELKTPVLERVNLSPFSEGYEFLDEGEGGSGDC